MVSFWIQSFHPQGKSPRIHWIRRQDGPQRQSSTPAVNVIHIAKQPKERANYFTARYEVRQLNTRPDILCSNW
jgi:hypothetical protein